MSQPKRVLVITDNMNTLASRLALGCNQVAVAEGWILRWTAPDISYLFTEWKPDGWVVSTSNPAVIDQIRKCRRPFVAVDMPVEGVPGVQIDDSAVGVAAAEYLLERGFHSFAGYGLADHLFSERRLQGFRETVLAQGGVYNAEGEKWQTVPKKWRTHSPPSGTNIQPYLFPKRLFEWFRSLPRPTGIFVACDDWGANLGNVCQFAGLRVPEDVAIVGADNMESRCECAHPPMSSVDIPRQKIGQEAALLLGKLMAGEPPPLRPLRIGPVGVVTRRSSDITAVPDPDVAAALGIILKHAGKPIQVKTILDLVPATQHGLERGFRKYLGRTMLQEIRRVHVEQAKRLLALTELTLPEVARKAGFADQSRLGKEFLRVTGMTPTEYRLRFGLRP